MQQPNQVGGMQFSVLEDVKLTSGHFLLVILVLLSVYVSRIPSWIVASFSGLHIQIAGLLLVIWLTKTFGWVHGILAALAYILIVSAGLRMKSYGYGNSYEPMVDYVPAVVFSDGTTTSVVPSDKRWFVEKVLGENPFLIREREVNTSAIQDFSEKGMSTQTK